MTVNVATPAPDSADRGLHLAGAISALVIAIGYLAIIGLYVPMGAPPSGVEARLAYIAANSGLWWAILILSVVTDLLFIPVAIALYQALKGPGRNLMIFSVVFTLLFVLLDLALTWSSYAVLIDLALRYASASDEAARSLILSAATGPAVLLESSLLYVYNSLTLSLGILLAGIAMLRGAFSKAAAWVGLATGLTGSAAVIGSIFLPGMGDLLIILASTLTMLWVFLTGTGLLKVAKQAA